MKNNGAKSTASENDGSNGESGSRDKLKQGQAHEVNGACECKCHRQLFIYVILLFVVFLHGHICVQILDWTLL